MMLPQLVFFSGLLSCTYELNPPNIKTQGSCLACHRTRSF
jgi:hypothetical protein